MKVRKLGRTTGLTDGVITDDSVNSLVGTKAGLLPSRSMRRMPLKSATTDRSLRSIGVGIRRKKSAIVLYVGPGAAEEHKNALMKIKEEVEPLNLMIVEEERSSTSSS